jgi:hypothetical protein
MQQFLPENGPGPKEGEGEKMPNPFTDEIRNGFEQYFEAGAFNAEQAKEFFTGRLLEAGVTQEQVQDIANQLAGIDTFEGLQ